MPYRLPSTLRRFAAGMLLLAIGSLRAAAEPPALWHVTGLARVARLTGENSLNHTDSRWNVAGTDLGHMFDAGDRLYMVFGDTFGHGFVAPPGAGPAPDWRSNVMAVTTDRNPADGLSFDAMITDAQGRASELLPARRNTGDVTTIPTNGFALGSRLFLHYMDVRQWGAPGEWTLSRAGLASSDDDGNTWTRALWTWPGDTRFGQAAVVRDGGFVYLFGIPGGRFGAVHVARAPEFAVLSQSGWRYYAGTTNGEAVWAATESAAAPVVPAPVGELSVMWNGYLGRWTMMYLMGPDIVFREAPSLLGPWSAPTTVVRASRYPGLYAPYMHPWLVENKGEVVYFTMSEWNPYAVSLMKVRLVRRPAFADAARAVRIAGGLEPATPDDLARLSPSGPLNLPRAAFVLRAAAGLE